MSGDIESLKKLAREADKQGFDSIAVMLYRKVLETELSNDAFWFRLSDCLQALGRHSEALFAINKIREVPRPRVHQLAMLRAQIAEGMSDLVTAEAELRQAVTLNSESTVTWVFLASFLARHNKVREAIEVLRNASATAVTGDMDEVHYLLGEYLKATGDFSAAKQEFKIAITLAQNDYPLAQNGLNELDFWDVVRPVLQAANGVSPV